jgi:hypothetical protein
LDWILDLLTQLGTTSNYNAIANLHTLQITAAKTKSSQARSVFNSRFLVTDVNSLTLVNCQLDHSAISSQPAL